MGESIFIHGLGLHFLLGFFVALIGLVIYPWVLPLLGQPEVVIQLSLPYFQLLLWSYLPITLFLFLKNFSDGHHLTLIGMVVTLAGNVVNFVGNYAFIYGKWGMPELGLTGAGVGTLAARISMLLLMIPFFLKNDALKSYFLRLPRLKISLEGFAQILRKGIFSALSIFSEGGFFSTCAIIAGQFGTIAGSANVVMTQISSMGFFLMTGFGQATAIRVGKEWGLGNKKNIRHITHTSMATVVIFLLIYATAITIFRRPITAIFTKDPEVINLAIVLLPMIIFYAAGDGVQMILLGSLRGLHDFKIPSIIAATSYFFIGSPAAYLFAHWAKWGAVGVWMGVIVVFFFIPIFLWLRFQRKLKH